MPTIPQPSTADGTRDAAALNGPPRWRHPLARIWFEIRLSWRFNLSDMPAVIVPSLVATVSAWHTLAQPAGHLPWALARALVFCWLYLLVHTFSNQATGEAEDRLNKPHRPIPSGTVTALGAHRRFGVAAAMFLGAGAAFGVLWWAVLWLAMVVVHNYLGSGRHWLLKNLHTNIGVLLLIGPAWQMVAPIPPVGWRWILAAIAYTVLVSMQDLRDIAGDLVAGRRTLPILLGASATRAILAPALVAFPALAHVLLIAPYPHGQAASVWELAFTAGCWLLAVRILLRRTPRADHVTYQIYCWLWCWLLAGPCFLPR